MNEDAPNIPENPQLQQLITEGWGYTIEFDHGDVKTGFHFLSGNDMEAMGPEERAKLGVEAHYQFGLAHGMGASSKDDTDP